MLVPRTSCAGLEVVLEDLHTGVVAEVFDPARVPVDDRDGVAKFYDLNALSNFVTDAPTLVGFDPFVSLVDYIEQRAGLQVAGGVA